ncbi:MAG: glycoside hydrolase family 97 N-terminal domain-containing protein, partial [Mucilaginibacter sp.]|uniref:glycoside hydrolase family 97 N-terminal domain-containing protein n=1 Tax=Mucilaginibacter sp. TaxID=1882438 RepID=UPI0032674D3F
MIVKKFTVFVLGIIAVACQIVSAQKLTVQSPNKKVSVDLINQENTNIGEWSLKVSHNAKDKPSEIIPKISLGLSRSDQDFTNLTFLSAGKPVVINEKYNLVHGKKAVATNSANEVTVYFQTATKAKLNVIIRAYNDGLSFRYEFPDKQGSYVLKDEYTAYTIPATTTRWLEKFNTANEGLYAATSDDKIVQQ